MKIIISQCVNIAGSKYPNNWRKEYESVIIPRVGDCIEDPIWKNPYEYKVTSITIDYYADECYVSVEDYIGDIPNERKDEMANMANLHGWKSSWKMYK